MIKIPSQKDIEGYLVPSRTIEGYSWLVRKVIKKDKKGNIFSVWQCDCPGFSQKRKAGQYCWHIEQVLKNYGKNSSG